MAADQRDAAGEKKFVFGEKWFVQRLEEGGCVGLVAGEKGFLEMNSCCDCEQVAEFLRQGKMWCLES